jgi:nicotinic acid mononucleotide adenylyltransferase
MEFKTFITEGKRDTVVFSHGRMNPVTVGHQKMVDAGQKLAQRLNADYELSITHSHDPKKNPLSIDQKLKHVKRAFPKVKVTATSKETPSFLHQAKRLHQQGYQHLVMVAGSDRVQEYHDTLHKYNGHPDFYNFKSIRVPDAKEMHKLAGVSLERDPDSEGAEGMSASKMRTHAANNDYSEFRKGVPAHFSDAQARELYNDVRQGQVRKESRDLRQQYLNGEIYNIGDRVNCGSVVAEIVYRGSTYVTLQLDDHNTEKYWIADLEERSGQYYTKTGRLKQNPSNPSGLSKKYSGELSHATQLARRQHFKKHGAKPSSDASAYKPAPGDAEAVTKLSKYTKRYHERYKVREQHLPWILMTAEQRIIMQESTKQITYNGYTTVNFDLCPGATITFTKVINNPALNPEFVMKALQATDAMLGVERAAMDQGFATEELTHDFTMYMGIAHDTLHLLGYTDADFETKYGKNWFETHMKTMAGLSMHNDNTFVNQYGTHLPVEQGEVEESMKPIQSTHAVQSILLHKADGKTVKRHNLVKKMDFKDKPENDMNTGITEAADAALNKKASESGVSVGTLRQVYKRGVAAWRTGHRPGTTPQQWGMARVNSFITKGKTYHTADKDLREAEEARNLPDSGLKQMGPYKHMGDPQRDERDVNFSDNKDVFHGIDKAVTDEIGFDGKPVGFVSFKSFMHEPENIKSAAEHDAARASIHAAQVTDFAKHGPSYKAQTKAKLRVEP